VRRAAGILELTGYLDRKPRQLSGGQRQRVAMGRCIVREPKVFLFDEPLSNLDAKLRAQMRLEIRKLQEDLKVTSVYVTHDQVEAMTLGDRLIIMDNGYASQTGTPIEVYERPANTFVAGFIGSPSMNFIDAALGAGGKCVDIPGVACLDFAGLDLSKQAGSSVILGIRPEHFRLVETERAKISLQVDHAEILGADTLVYGRFAGHSSPVTVRLPALHHLQKHEMLPIEVLPKDLHVFDKSSGLRLE
jgi:sn-glycerol 3-phosphate transport system ATP-binding protein